jgi:hypothetical protein
MIHLVAEAFRKGFQAGRRNLAAMLALEAAMALVVALYYFWPATRPFFAELAALQHRGGVLAGAIGSALAGGLLSEISAVYFLDGGRWTYRHLENTAFKLALFSLSGALVYEFYQMQAVWFGDGPSWRIVLPKVLADQFGYSFLWSVPSQTLFTRWHTLGYSWRKTWDELKTTLVTERMLPVLVANWMFWIPGLFFIYAMPLNLQMPLALFGTAIWSLLLTSAAREPNRLPTGTVQDLIAPETEIAAPSAE